MAESARTTSLGSYYLNSASDRLLACGCVVTFAVGQLQSSRCNFDLDLPVASIPCGICGQISDVVLASKLLVYLPEFVIQIVRLKWEEDASTRFLGYFS